MSTIGLRAAWSRFCRSRVLPHNVPWHFSPTFAKKRAQSRYPFCHHNMAFSSHDKLANQPEMGVLASARILGAFIETDEIKERIKRRWSCSRCRAILWWQSQAASGAWHRGTLFVGRANYRDDLQDS